MKGEMTGRQRLLAALKGEDVDRAPLWLREGFEFDENITDPNDFSSGWKTDSVYRELLDYVKGYADYIKDWTIYPFNRYLEIPSKYIHSKITDVTPNIKRIDGVIETPKGDLNYVYELRRGVKTGWYVEDPVKSVEDLKKLAAVPFEIDYTEIDKRVGACEKLSKELGDRGILRTHMNSPIIAISGCMSLENFLRMSVEEEDLFKELVQEITGRQLAIVDAAFGKQKLDTIVNFGGSEQCTPPMMSPHSFDKYVVPYDSQVVSKLKEYGILTSCHCHGKVRHALKCMIDIGYDGTDPVEPPPQGDVTYAEARKIADGKITLLGNIEWSELEHSDTEYIRNRVREVMELGSDRLIMGSSAGPISRISQKLADNYRAWVDAMREFN